MRQKMKRCCFLLVLLMCLVTWGYVRPGKELLRVDLSSAEVVSGYECSGKAPKFLPNGGPNGQGNALAFTVEKAGGTNIINVPVPVEGMEGRIVVEADVRGENVSYYGASYLGPKVMLVITEGNGKTHYPNLDSNLFCGTYDWTHAVYITNVPKGVTKMTFWLGIQTGEGHIEIANVKISRAEVVDDSLAPPPPPNPAAAKIPRGPGKGTRFRGVMSGSDLSPDAFATLEKWGANLLRYQIIRGKEPITSEQYLAWIDSEITRFDKVLPLAREHGVSVIIDLHTGPGTKVTAELSNVLGSDTMADVLCETWRRLARHYKGNPSIYAYDILNEPVGSKEISSEFAWKKLVVKAIAAIREIDQDTPVMVAWHHSKPFEVDDAHVIYTPHFYSPHELTHQGVGGRPTGYQYPGWINGSYWDKEMLRLAFRDIILYQKEHNVRICIGEFSISIFTKQRHPYIADCISLFEEYGWDWCYHAFREARLWSPEHTRDSNGKTVNVPDPDLIRVLSDAMHKNQKP